MHNFESGSNRSSKLPRYELLDGEIFHQMAVVMEAGVPTHGENNWQTGGPEFFKDIPRHIFYHTLMLMSGDTSENHIAHIACNCMFYAYYSEYFREYNKLKRGSDSDKE